MHPEHHDLSLSQQKLGSTPGPAGAGDSGLRRGTGRKAAGAVRSERGPVDTVAVSVDLRYVNGAAACEGQNYCI